MGRVGTEIIQTDVQSIIQDLNAAAAAELNDAFRYKLLANLASGLNAPEVAEWFAETAEHEWGHLNKWIERITILGGRPFTRSSQAEGLSYAPYLEPPEDPTDLRKMLQDSLEGERAAIRFYAGLFQKTQQADPVTAEMAREALADEVKDEDDLERFLASFGR